MSDELYIRRCFNLARLGAGKVSPNPMVGAVLVHNGRIIGEGWHQQYGQAHAEVNAVNNVKPTDRQLIEHSTLYVSLEPCCIHGNTPPCTDLILRHNIKKVVVSTVDQTDAVKGEGLSILRKRGVEVIEGILEEEGKEISKVRNTFTQLERPFIQLKFAKTKGGYMGRVGEQVWISNLLSKRLAHKMRSEFDAILIGTKTALIDSPQLTNRLWYGKSPLRIVLDRTLKVPLSNSVFSDDSKTWHVSEKESPQNHPSHILPVQLNFDESVIANLLHRLAINKITSLIVEGGAYTLNRFIENGFWDEAWVFTGKRNIQSDGIVAPLIPEAVVGDWQFGSDLLTIYQNNSPQPLNLH